MCGRYTLTKKSKADYPEELVEEASDLGLILNTPPLFNAAPSQEHPVFVVREDQLQVQLMTWTLIPHWSKDGKSSFHTINAKSETAAESRLYATYFKKARCLIPADGFYEWKKEEENPTDKPVKQPFHIQLKNKPVFMMAGLFSVWVDTEGNEHPTFSVMTCPANDTLSGLHHRMPVILPPEKQSQWLDRKFQDVSRLKEACKPYTGQQFEFYPVSRKVNSPKNNDASCLEKVKI